MADGQLFPSDEDTQILNTVNIPQIDQQITVAEGKIILTQLLFQLFNGKRKPAQGTLRNLVLPLPNLLLTLTFKKEIAIVYENIVNNSG